MRLHGLFIVGADTGVGKTQVGAALARALVDRGAPVRPRKPVESGCERRDGALHPADADALRRAARSADALSLICPHRFAEPLSPERAAQRAGGRLTLEQVEAACRDGMRAGDFALVEGAGGLYSPIAENALNADLAQRLELPTLLVAADRLGVVNAALLAAEAIERRGLPLAALILNRHRADGDDMANPQALRRRLNCPLFTLPEVADATPWKGLRLPAALLATLWRP